MADWIKVEVSTSQKIEVFILSEILDLDADSVLGKLVKLWSWADANTVDGHASSVTKKILDRVVGCDGFADAMLDDRVKWLKQTETGDLIFPNFDRHNGSGAKKRALAAQRKAAQRQKEEAEKMSRSQRDKSETREEKRREDIKDPPNKSPLVSQNGKAKAKSFNPADVQLPEWLPVQAWVSWVNYRREIKKAIKSKQTVTQAINTLSKSRDLGYSPEEIINRSIGNGWQGLFEPKEPRRNDQPEPHWNSPEGWKDFI